MCREAHYVICERKFASSNAFHALFCLSGNRFRAPSFLSSLSIAGAGVLLRLYAYPNTVDVM